VAVKAFQMLMVHNARDDWATIGKHCMHNRVMCHSFMSDITPYDTVNMVRISSSTC